MATFVVAHGAWSAGWAWKKMRPLMRASGHELWTPTYTGLGERAHLGHADVSLDTHIQDIVAVLEIEDLNDVVLIGHAVAVDPGRVFAADGGEGIRSQIVTLDVGARSESVDVVAGSPLLETQSANLAQTVTRQMIAEGLDFRFMHELGCFFENRKRTAMHRPKKLD